MNPRERLLTTMRGGRADRVPLSLEGLPSGDYTVHIEDGADGGADRGSLPIRIR